MKIINILLAMFFLITTALATETRVCPPCPYHPCPTDFVTLIKKDVTISVPGILPIAPFTQVDTIQDALDALENYKISKKATVTIQLTQNADNYDTINITHPDGDKIRIVGNCGGGACTIQFKSGATGVYIAGGNKLGYLNNFNLIGGNKSGGNGIWVTQNSGLICGSKITVQHFYNGVLAEEHSYIAVPSVQSTNNSSYGIIATGGSTIVALKAVASDNNSDGICAFDSSSIYVNNGYATRNQGRGINADIHGFIEAEEAVSENNHMEGFRAVQGGVIYAPYSQANNNPTQFVSQISSLISAPGATTKGDNPIQVGDGGRVCYVNGGGCVSS